MLSGLHLCFYKNIVACQACCKIVAHGKCFLLFYKVFYKFVYPK